jgi:Bacterial PH domain
MGLFSGAVKSTSNGSLETKKLHTDYGQLLIDGEIIEVGFVVVRDTFLFTNKRLILIDIQGISGRQIEYFSVPYCNITKFSVQTGGSFELDAELKLWIGSDTIPLEKKFNKDVNIYEVQKVLASHILR